VADKKEKRGRKTQKLGNRVQKKKEDRGYMGKEYGGLGDEEG